MQYEICDINEDDMTVCWAVDGGKIFIHFTNNLGELLSLRKTVDIMIEKLEELKADEDKKHKEELSFRAKRVKELRERKKKNGKDEHKE